MSINTPQSNYMPTINDVPSQLINRNSLDDFMTTMAHLNTREPDVQQEARARGSLNNAIDIVERNVPRDVTPDRLAARDGTEELASRDAVDDYI
jgi:hypothetical protein